MQNPADDTRRLTSNEPADITCPRCGLKVRKGIAKCPQDGTRLIAEPGGVFAQQYEFLEALGTGGMSVIYKARHRALNKIVAIKMLHEYMVEEKHVRRFQQEAKAASTLDHPNIIKVLDFGLTDSGQPYMVMDVAEGRSLAQVLKELHELPTSQCLIIFIDIANALIHAHSKGILHRDLKPSNIMLATAFDRPMQAKLVDFGIAKFMLGEKGATSQQLTQSGDLFGSPPYMSPEQCLGRHLDARSDMYSFGCLMFESLAGRVPIQGESLVDTISKQTTMKAPLLREVRPDKHFPTRLEDIVDKCLAKNPDNRYHNMEEVKAALEAIQSEMDDGSLKEKSSMRQFMRDALRMRTAIILMIAGLLVIASLAALVAFNRSIHKEKQAEQVQETAIDQGKFLPMFVHAQIDDELLSKCLSVNNHQQELNLNDSKVTDRGMSFVNLQTDLTKLSLDKTKISDVGLKQLAALHKIKNLSLKGTKITSEGLRTFGFMPSIQSLSLDYCKIDDTGMQYLKNLNDLNSLGLIHCPVSGQSVENLKDLPFLQTLNIGSIPLKEQEMPIFQQFKHLQKLAMRKCDLTDAGLQYVPPQLEILEVPANGKITDKCIPYILNLPHLKRLDISYTLITNNGLKELSRAPELDDLALNGYPVTKETIHVLSTFKKLRSLHLAHCNNIDDEVVAELAQLKNLKSLDVSENYRMTSKAGTILATEMPQLKKLGIDNTQILSESSVQELAKMKNLHELRLKGCDFDGPDYYEVRFLREQLTHCDIKAN